MSGLYYLDAMKQNNADVSEVDALGETLEQRFRDKGIETWDDFVEFTSRTADLWWNSVPGVGETTARRVENEWSELATNEA